MNHGQIVCFFHQDTAVKNSVDPAMFFGGVRKKCWRQKKKKKKRAKRWRLVASSSGGSRDARR